MADTLSNDELTEATADGLRWITYARVGTELLLLVSMVVLARVIPPAAFGMFALVLIVQELAVNVPSEGVASALVQRRSIDRRHLEGGLALSLAIGAVLALVSLCAAFVLVDPLFGPETAELVALASPWFLFGALATVPMAVLRRRLDFRRLSLLGLVQSSVRSAVSILLAVAFGLDASALVLGGIAGVACFVAVAITFVRLPRPRWHRQEIRDLLPYGGPASLASFAWAGFRNGDYAIVGARLGVAQAGFYFRGFQLAVEYQTKISQIMSQMAFPVLSRTADPDAMFALRRRMIRLVTVVTFPMLAALVVLAPVLVPWVFGPQWEPAVLPTQILAGAGAATVVIDATGTVLMASGRTRAMLAYGIAHFAVYVAAVLFASRWGLAGVSVAAVAVHVVFLFVAYEVMLRDRPERSAPFLWNDISAAFVGSLAFAAVAAPLAAVLSDVHPLLHLAAVSAAGAAAYLSTLWLWFRTDFDDLVRLLRRLVPTGKLRRLARLVPLPAGSRAS
jgi:PST family polysaccharide transporter